MTSAGEVRRWSVEEVTDWLYRENFGQYADIFMRYRIDGIALCDLQKDKFDSLTRPSMGRDDRASMLWSHINLIKRAKSRNAHPNANPKRKPTPHLPPEPPQRDYRTDPQYDEGGEVEDTYEAFTEDDDLDVDVDTFTDDEGDDLDYMEPNEETSNSGPPQVPTRPMDDLNASWGHSQTEGSKKLTELQKGLMRRMSERAVKKIPPTGQRMMQNHGDQEQLYLEPADDTYDVPDANEGNEEEIYDIPDDGPTVQTPTRQPPSVMSQQQNRMVSKCGPRIPPGRPNQFRSVGRDHHHSNDPPAPPIPSRVQPRPITPEEDEEYAMPDELDSPGEYIDPEEPTDEEFYLEPEVPHSMHGAPRSVQSTQGIQSRRLPTLPPTIASGGAPVPPRPEKPNSLKGFIGAPELPPAIPSRPSPTHRVPKHNSSSHLGKVIPPTANGVEQSSKADRPRSPPSFPTNPRIPDLQRIAPSATSNNNENSNHSTDVARHVKNMRNRFEDNNNTDNGTGRRQTGTKVPVKVRQDRTPNVPTTVIPRPATSGGNSTPRKTGIPESTSSTTSFSSMSSNSSSLSSSSGSDIVSRKGKIIVEPPSWSEMPPLPPPTPKSALPQQNQPPPVTNQSSLMRIAERGGFPKSPTRSQPTPAPATPESRSTVPATSSTLSSSSTSSSSLSPNLEECPWFHAGISRQDAEKALRQCRKDGAFIVRPSARRDKGNPYSLSLWFNGRVRNLQIRHREDQKYALGSRKDNEMAFDKPAQLIQYHMSNSLILAQDEGKTVLSIPAPVYQ